MESSDEKPEETTENIITEEGQRPPRKKGKHKKDKPWDNDSIDHWKIDPFQPGDMSANLLEESSFATLFPKYREKYLKEVWGMVTKALAEYGIDCQLNLIEGSMTVKTTRKTWDPYAVIKARDLIRLLSRSVPFQQAIKIMQDDLHCDIIKIGGMVRNREKFVKRRQRLIGPDGATLKAIELLTNCYVLVQGKTVVAMGPFKALKQLRQIVVDCMNNIHPIYNIKTLMIKRELSKDPQLSTENWDRFLPKFKKKNIKKKPTRTIEKREYTPFPPAQTPSKVDLQLESGEYFLSESQKKKKKEIEKEKSQQEAVENRQKERQRAFKPPKEKKGSIETKRETNAKLPIEEVKSKVSDSMKKRKSNQKDSSGPANDFLLAPTKPAKKKKLND